MRVKSMPDGGQRKRTSKLTLFRSGSSRSPTFLNVEFDDLSTLSTPDTSSFSVTLMFAENFHVSMRILSLYRLTKHPTTTFVCKRHYVGILTEELGLYSLPGNPTYNLTDFFSSEVLDNHKSVLTLFGIESSDDGLDLPYIYWIPKMHKTPYKHRFIAGSSKCTTKPLSVLLTKLLTHIKQGLQNHCETAYSRRGINQMWILKNSKELLEHLKSATFNHVTSIKSFDFSTLYTTIPHQKLKDRLTSIIRNAFIFKNGNRR